MLSGGGSSSNSSSREAEKSASKQCRPNSDSGESVSQLEGPPFAESRCAATLRFATANCLDRGEADDGGDSATGSGGLAPSQAGGEHRQSTDDRRQRRGTGTGRVTVVCRQEQDGYRWTGSEWQKDISKRNGIDNARSLRMAEDALGRGRGRGRGLGLGQRGGGRKTRYRRHNQTFDQSKPESSRVELS